MEEQEEDELRLRPHSSKKPRNKSPMIIIEEGTRVTFEFPNKSIAEATYTIIVARTSSVTEPPSTDVQMGSEEFDRTTVTEEETATTAPQKFKLLIIKTMKFNLLGRLIGQALL